MAHSARESPAVRQSVSSTCTASWARIQSRSALCGTDSAVLACWQIASTVPVESRAEQLVRQLSDPPPGDPVAGSQRHDCSAQPWPNADPATAAWQLRRRPGPALRGAPPMGAMLDQQHTDRRQLAHLAATELAAGSLALIL